MGDTDRETGAADLHREFGVVVVMVVMLVMGGALAAKQNTHF